MLLNAVFALAVAAGVSAHGFISGIQIGDETFDGPLPFSKNNAASPIHKISTTFPITSATDASMNCGQGSQAASEVAAVKAGQKITISWKSGQNKNWGHSLGPIMTYLAQVPAGQTADKFDTRNAKFFKIDEVGQTGGAGTGWVQASIKEGKTFDVTIPQGLPAGDYVMRHELIALHFATKKDGAQFYPGCVNLRVDGGAASPKAIAADTVEFPGGYVANDKSLFVPDLHSNSFVYTFPGPQLAKSFAGAASVPGNTTDSLVRTTATEPSAPTTKPKCKRAENERRRVRSRIMRHLV
ncbi:putative effector protein/Endoglucanase-4 [Ceratobasidium theobromae]|uniref:lytic cellulose monooxygenase (C4-dehydrogenating) n=1 Tax=Ceratobasidium theobromae TaxID=1582974 RepID=A0A5N5Q9H4_9AGAM|nr:putative effector protein/Endoglucanase-4 [Ceratobasidium theobromae]